MHLTSASFAYPLADAGTRAELTRRLATAGDTGDAFVLATCLRIEVAVPGDTAALEPVLSHLFGDVAAGAEFRRDAEAVHHLFRIAAGLESPMVGEIEILTQFRQAMKEAPAGGLFARLLETAVGTGRQARQALPHSPHDSLAAVAAQVVGGADRVAVLGAGMMARAVIASVGMLPAPPVVTVVARDVEAAAGLAGEVWPFSRAVEALTDFPAVISATSAKHRIVDDEELEKALADRAQPLTLVDMAMPPDFRPAAGGDLRYVAIDDLARLAERRPRDETADALVAAAAAEAYRRYAGHHSVGPVIGNLIGFADREVERTVDRFAGRLRHPSDRDVLQQAAHTAVRSVLARPLDYLNAAQPAGPEVDVIADAFGVETDTAFGTGSDTDGGADG